ncbi:cation:proton antiporter [Lutimonas zeaxanthinifaciens]|uniref:cation:proton antiporter n=1 Tax=Lutimonas zeaxanthinifaciens TaxID=3060215 RepID=UPI00265D2307|nr:sodium:proton antiporter [Lutimonas sp. YSD2104]WKK64882.1 sodium:proton antiporter [Lutimonas sp. YSD2104]
MVELAGIIILGIIAQWVAWKFKIPAILPLILIGLLVGPISTLISEDGNKWIEPVWNGKQGLFPGESLFNFVSLAIALILFEGGMTLKKDEIRSVGPVIYKLITLGAFITMITAGVAAHFIIGLNWPLSFLFSSLIIVTGPTVITPILRNLPLKKDISTILKWEGILIDPIGALVAVLVFEFIRIGGDHGMEYSKETLVEFGKIVIIGLSIGFTSAYAFATSLKQRWIPHYLLNVVALALVLGVFVLADLFAHESGLLAVVIMGMVLGNMKLDALKDVLYFKETISILLISILFILLSANINLSDLELIYNWNSLILFSLVVLLIRPLGVFLSARKSGLSQNEKVFISWVGPRGIVAAGIASLFGLKLTMQGVQNANYITPLVFMIVLGTVLLNATTAKLMARFTRVLLKKSEGILIVGASPPARLIAKYLQNNNRRVVLIDSNRTNIEKSQEEGLEAMECNIYEDDIFENIELNDVGFLLALTGSNTINEYALSKLRGSFGEEGAFRLISPEEMRDPDNNPEEGLFSQTDDFINISEVVRDYPIINEVKIKSPEHYKELMKATMKEIKSIPVFVKGIDNEIHIIPASYKDLKVNEGYTLMYIGKKLKT